MDGLELAVVAIAVWEAWTAWTACAASVVGTPEADEEELSN